MTLAASDPSNWGLKRDLYEGGIRVPTIMWWPGTVKPGSAAGVNRAEKLCLAHGAGRAGSGGQGLSGNAPASLGSFDLLGRQSDHQSSGGGLAFLGAGRHV